MTACHSTSSPPPSSHRRRGPLASGFCALALLAGPAWPGGAAAAGEDGVVVEEVGLRSAAARAGLQPGDVILSWSPGAGAPEGSAGGLVASPFELVEVEIEQAPRGAVILRGRRGPVPASWTLPPGAWSLRTRPGPADARPPRDGAPARREARLDPTEGAASERRRGLWASLAEARALLARGDWEAAAQAFERAAREAERSRDLEAAAQILVERGDRHQERKEWDQAEGCYRRALEARQKRRPESLAVAATLSRLGALAWTREDVDASAVHHREALGLWERLAPGSLELGQSLRVLGNVAGTKSDLATAEGFLRRALSLAEAKDPEGLDWAQALMSLGVVAGKQGDSAAEADCYRRALQVVERLDPDSLFHGKLLMNLSAAAGERGDLAGVEAYGRRALAVFEKVEPEGGNVRVTRENLAQAALDRGDLAAAEDEMRRVVALQEKSGGATVYMADALHTLAGVLAKRDRVPEAAEQYRRALAIREQLMPGTREEADTLHELGLALRKLGDPLAAAHHLCRATDAVEDQRSRFGGTREVEAAFGAHYASFYRECLLALASLGRTSEAFQVLERSKARLLRAGLAERDRMPAEVPADLVRQRAEADAEYDRAQAQLAALNLVTDGARVEALKSSLRELRRTQEHLLTEIRGSGAAAGSLPVLAPLDLSAAQDALDPGTLLLSYAVTSEKTLLFAVSREGLDLFSIPEPETTLRRRIEDFRKLLRWPGEERVLQAQAQELYASLVQPAEALVAGSRRVLVSPDGPLHALPFAALGRRRANGRFEYLVERKPLHSALSATVYHALAGRRPGPGAPASTTVLAAFGDPVYPPLSQENSTQIRDQALRAAIERERTLVPLPATRDEVRAIASLFSGRVATYLGPDATEERAKGLGKGVRYIHFASHGLLNETFPLDSGLALTLRPDPALGRDNGLLQAWEVLEKMRIDAELVTLSACESGLGKELGGEGLLGLVYAFQAAGARSVLASLWPVADTSTAAFMKRFYRHLRNGSSKDEALRSAQRETIAAGRHPFHWGAFQLFGDWK